MPILVNAYFESIEEEERDPKNPCWRDEEKFRRILTDDIKKGVLAVLEATPSGHRLVSLDINHDIKLIQ